MSGGNTSFNDVILNIAFVAAALSLACEWNDFQACCKPMNIWLFVSYSFGAAFCLFHHLGKQHAPEGKEFLLNLRQQKALPRTLMLLMWAVLLPLFTAWTLVGFSWLYAIKTSTPKCLPEGTPFWFIACWQFLSFLWVVVHVVFGTIACVLERRLRSAEQDIRSVQDEDGLARWGRMSDVVPEYALNENRGLSVGEIEQLPTTTWCCSGKNGVVDCPICLNDFDTGDLVRQLPGCGHSFHKSCIDLWMLRRADCPLCKCEVRQACDTGCLY